jgi:hypothetical protein
MNRESIRVGPLSTLFEGSKAPTSGATRHGGTIHLSNHSDDPTLGGPGRTPCSQ